MLLQELNMVDKEQLRELLGKCCGASAWVDKMGALFPFADPASLLEKATSTWYACRPGDWLEAFTHHPKIGDMASLKQKFTATADWAAGEQAAVNQTSQKVLEKLAEANNQYEKKFGYIFIVCATGKSAEEMLHLLSERLLNNPEDEIKIAMEEQNKITVLRLEKLLNS